uniref:BTB domain-containing protein n=1 Tax=Zea mays TaxID=4577 RepID=A0A804P5R7_MAIZE
MTVECTITVLRDLDAPDREQPLPVPPPSDLHQHLGELLQSSDGADVTFHVSEESFTTHKIFLAARSPVFKVEFFGGMKEALLLWRSETWRLLCSGSCFTSSIPTWPQSSMVTRSLRRRRPSLSTYW